MPMVDAFIPDGALTAAAEARLMTEITDMLIRLEGLDPASERVQAVSVIFLHRPTLFVAGRAAEAPRYRFIPSVPEGQYSDETHELIVRGITEAVARAEAAPFDEVAPRVWVFPNEVADGGWGGRGAIRRLKDILAFLVGDKEGEAAAQRLADRRRNAAIAIVRSALETVR